MPRMTDMALQKNLPDEGAYRRLREHILADPILAPHAEAGRDEDIRLLLPEFDGMPLHHEDVAKALRFMPEDLEKLQAEVDASHAADDEELREAIRIISVYEKNGEVPPADLLEIKARKWQQP